MPFHVFHGNDIKLLRRELKNWEDSLSKKNPDLETYSPDNPVLGQILEKISSDSLFGGLQYIKIYEFEKLAQFEKIFDYPGEHYVALVSFQEKNPLKKKKKGVELHSFNLPRSYQLEKTIYQRFQGKMAPEAVAYLSKNMTSLVDLDELEDTMADAGLSFLSLADLSKIQGDTESKAYLIVEDILAKKAEAAIIEMNHFLEGGAYHGSLISNLSSQIEKLYTLKKLKEQGKDYQATEILKLHPFVLKKLGQTASTFPLKKLEKMILSIPKLDYQIKAYGMNFAPYFLEKFILEIASK